MSGLPVQDWDAAAEAADPFAGLRQLARSHPVVRDTWGNWVVLGYDDCRRLLADPELRNDYDHLLTREGITDGPLLDWWRLAMLNSNAPQHTRLRSLVSQAFTPRAVERVRLRARALSEELVDGLEGASAIEFVSGFAHLLPIQVICELLGVPREDHDAFNRWTIEMTYMFSHPLTAERRAIAEAAIVGLGEHVEGLVEERRRHPTDDLLSGLVGAEADGDRLSHAELVAMVINLLNGGHDTTRSLLMILLSILAADGELAARLRSHPELVPGAVEEGLRLEPPVPLVYRVSTAPKEVGGTTIPADSTITLCLLTANRDPAHFADPDRLDPARSGATILSFGHGPHFCIGNALARLEAAEAVGVLLRRWADVRLDGPRPAWLPNQGVRSFPALPLLVS